METVDIAIIGAGLSGIGAAVHLKKRCPDKSFVILEGRERMGGTWDLFRYPGIRSDSDMYTLGYNFKPWTNPKSIADGPSIKAYIEETAEEYGLNEHIRYGQKVTSASWSSARSDWTLDIADATGGQPTQIRAAFVFSCTGYYNYAHGHDPEFEGSEEFTGPIVRPQFWPEDLDYTGKKVVVVGSGATAVTVVPAMGETAEHVTMLQRSPTYVMSVPLKDSMSNWLRRWLPDRVVYRITRTRNIGLTYLMYYLSKWRPEFVRRKLLEWVSNQIGPDIDMKHFEPHYNPWDERLCAVPDGDFFTSMREGKISVVTDYIERFEADGIRLKSGDLLPADIIVTATGLDLQFMGGVQLTVDGQPFDDMSKMNYRGTMVEDLPNIGFLFGYTNASWTLKSDLSCEYLCRVLNLMDQKGMTKCVPVNRDASVEEEPFLSMRSGYIQRGIAQFPRQGSKRPWRLYQNYILDLVSLRYGRLRDGVLQLSNADQETTAREEPVAAQAD